MLECAVVVGRQTDRQRKGKKQRRQSTQESRPINSNESTGARERERKRNRTKKQPTENEHNKQVDTLDSTFFRLTGESSAKQIKTACAPA